MMYPMRLRRHHNVAKKTEIGFDVAMIKPGIPGSKDIQPVRVGKMKAEKASVKDRHQEAHK
jgi:hypothetical protein